MEKPEKWWKHISIPVFLLVAIFAMSSWVDLSGVYVEMPYLINTLPEGWALASQSGFAFVLANVGPLLYVIAVKLYPGKIKEWPFVLIIIGVGMTMCLCLVYLWDKTAYIAGQERSVGFLSIVSILSLVDCTSSVVYIPYMARFKTEYLTAYFMGKGLGSLIPGLVGLGQGVGSDPECVNSTTVTFNETTGDNITEWKIEAVYNPPLFSVEIYFLFLFGILLLSGISFLILHLAPFCKQEHDQKKFIEDRNSITYTLKEINNNKEELLQKMDKDETRKSLMPEVTVEISNRRFVFLLILLTSLTALVYGISGAIFPYSAMPYGNMTFNLLVRLYSASVPIGAFLSLFHSTKSLTFHILMTMVCVILVGYHIFLAFCSPNPPFQRTFIGSALVISTGVMSGLISQYMYVSIGAILKTSRGRIGLMWGGACVQAGGILGSVISFLAINVFEAFVDQPPCVKTLFSD